MADTVNKQTSLLDPYPYKYDTYINGETLKGIFDPPETVLVQKDSLYSDQICIRPTIPVEQILSLDWRLVGKDFDSEGQLKIRISPIIIEKSKVEEYEYPLEDEVRLEKLFWHLNYLNILAIKEAIGKISQKLDPRNED